jgi:hypothetical protein
MKNMKNIGTDGSFPYVELTASRKRSICAPFSHDWGASSQPTINPRSTTYAKSPRVVAKMTVI